MTGESMQHPLDQESETQMTDDQFYRAFEARFRGSRELIRQRLEVYLPLVTPLAKNSPAKVLDVGCGRGEWIELLAAHGFDALGVDLDDGMLSEAQALGLNVAKQDALEALDAAPEGSLAIVSGFHIAEHLPFEVLSDLIKRAHRALRPGGLLILETPNAENLRVGTLSFHNDPTHVKPIPPQVMAFLGEYHGFDQSQTMGVNAESLPDGRLGLWDIIAGSSPDYALIAQVAGGSTRFELPKSVGNQSIQEMTMRYDTFMASAVAPNEALVSRVEALENEVMRLRKWSRSGGRTKAALRRLFGQSRT